MQYALAHPYNVKSIFSMGTPYNGSDFGEVKKGEGENATHPFLEIVDVDDDNAGVKDILNGDLYQSYKSFWNNNYGLYQHISFNPIGSYVDLGFILQCVRDLVSSTTGITPAGETALTLAMEVVDVGLGALMLFSGSRFIESFLINKAISLSRHAINRIFDTSKAPAWLSILNNINIGRVFYPHLGFSFSPTNIILEDDLFIDLDSQLADGYSGDNINRKVKLMTAIDQIYGKKSTDSVGIAHNLETHDEDIIGYVIRNIGVGVASDISMSKISDTEGEITGISKTSSSSLSLPSNLNGVSITRIHRVAIYQISYVNLTEDEIPIEQVTSITIPASVTEIEDWAFNGLVNLQEIIFEEGSQLQKIGVGAFYGCSSLQQINLPSSLTEIGNYAFMNCSSLPNLTIPASVTNIGVGAFYGCETISSFAVATGNTAYAASDGVLYNNGMSKLCAYPAGKKATTYSAPDKVTEVGEYAFSGNKFLKKVELNNVTNLGTLAFNNCSQLATINGAKVNYAEISSFVGTAWFNEDAKELSIGQVLLRYDTAKKEANLNGYAYIAQFAFAPMEENGYGKNNDLEKVVISGDVMTTVNLEAFNDCEALVELYLMQSSVVTIDDSNWTKNTNFTFCVPIDLCDGYRAAYNNYDFIESITVNYVANNAVVYQTAARYNEVYTVDCEVDITGYDLDGWYLNSSFTGEKCESLQITTSEELSLYAKLTVETYTVYLEANGGSLVGNNEFKLNFGDAFITNDNISKTGHTFEGWSLTDDGGVNFKEGDIISKPLHEDGGSIVVYAVWSANRYNIICENLVDNVVLSVKKYTYGIGLSTMPELYRTNSDVPQVFDKLYGWYSDSAFTKPVTSISPTTIGDVILYAKYDYFLIGLTSNQSQTVTDGDVMNQPCYELNVSKIKQNYSTYEANGFNKVLVKITVNYDEEQDGYQEFYVYSDSVEVWSEEAEFNTQIQSNLTYNNDEIFIEMEKFEDATFLTVRFGAHGTFRDNWTIKSISVEVYLTF